MVSGGESKVVAAGPSLPEAVPLRSVTSMAAATVVALVAIPVVMAEAASEVTLAAPPPLADRASSFFVA